jgi:hypothetical protein
MTGGFDPKQPAMPAIHFVDATSKSLNMRNLSKSNIAYLDK